MLSTHFRARKKIKVEIALRSAIISILFENMSRVARRFFFLTQNCQVMAKGPTLSVVFEISDLCRVRAECENLGCLENFSHFNHRS